MGKKLVDLSQSFGLETPLWPNFEDVKIERFHYHSKSGVLTQGITAPMHSSRHADSPIHKILLGNGIMVVKRSNYGNSPFVRALRSQPSRGRWLAHDAAAVFVVEPFQNGTVDG